MFFINLFVFPLIYHLKTTAAAETGLYSLSDDVVVLTHENFADNVYGEKTAWIIEFYNSWCGHCRRFAPTWKSVATDVKDWNSIVQVGAIDCSTNENLEICRNYDIKGYPTMRLLLPYSTTNDTGEEFHEQDPIFLRERIVDFVTGIGGMATRGWPNLQPLESIEHIWGEAKNHHKHVALIFEDETSYIGREVILDMSAYKDVLVRRALKPLMLKFGIKNFPSLYLLDSKGMYQQLAAEATDREQFTDALLIIRGGQDPEVDANKGDHPMQELTVKSEEEILQVTTRLGVYMQDLESTLSYLMRQEVAINRNMTGDALNSLKKFLLVLAKYFPGREKVKGYLWRVHTWLEDVNKELSGLHWLQTIDSFQTPKTSLPDRIKWVGCEGSENQYRGYPCGLWTLFHTLTVSAYNIEKGNEKFHFRDVLNTIASYMKYFFGCADCSRHFLKLANNIDKEVNHLNDSVLWLWHAHNFANDRLKTDVSTDPKHPKIQFPSPEMCSQCHKSSSSSLKSHWNTPEVLAFLINFYSKEKIISIQDESGEQMSDNSMSPKDEEGMDWWEMKQRRKDIEKIWDIREKKRKSKEAKIKSAFIHEGKKKFYDERYDINESMVSNEDGNVHYAFGFNRLDVGMCVIFYVMCTVIVLILYYHFAARRCRFPKKLPY